MAALRMPPPSPSSTSSDQPPTSPISRIGTGRGFPKNELAKFRSPPLLCRPAAERRQPSNAKIAQLVEQLAFNQLVLGSSPSLRTSFPNSLRVRTSGISKLYGFPRYASKRASLPHPFRIGPLCSDRVCEGDFSGDLPLPPPSSSSRTTILHLASSPPHTAAAPPIRSLPWPLRLIQLVKEPLRLVLRKHHRHPRPPSSSVLPEKPALPPHRHT